MRIAQRAARLARFDGLRTDVKLLFQSALALLVIAVGIGALEGQNRQAPSPELAATHVAAGAIGWMLLGGAALSLMLFGGGTLPTRDRRYARVVSVLAVASVSCYVLAVVSGGALARVIFATAVLLSGVALLGWLGMRSAQIRLGLPQIALLLATLALIFAATFGMLIEAQSATSQMYFPGDTASARPVALAGGYLLLAGMAVSEWRLQPSSHPASHPASPAWPWLGLAQVALAFVAAVALGVGFLLNVTAVVPVSIVFELAAGALFALRFAPRMRSVRWLERGGERHFAFGAIFLVAYLGFFAYLLARLTLGIYLSYGGIPSPLTTALDHLMFLGVMTNVLFGLILDTTRDRKALWPAAEDLLFWGMNLGVLGFVVGLVVRNSVLAYTLQGIFTPILAACLLVGIVVCSVRLQTARVRIEIEEPIRAGG
jgi:hypothetical protein